jgi:hypothetical protein
MTPMPYPFPNDSSQFVYPFPVNTEKFFYWLCFSFFKIPVDHKTQTSQALWMHFLRNFLDKGLGPQNPLNYEIEES